MRILFLTSQPPHPATSGTTIKSASILAYLAQHHDVRCVCLRSAPFTRAQAEWAAGIDGVDSVALTRGRTPANLLRSYVARIPLSIQRNRSRRMARLVAARLGGETYDALFVDGWLMAQYAPRWFRGLRLLHEHNAEHVIWTRQAELEPSPWRRALVRLERDRVRRYEASILPRFDVVFAVSEADRRALLDLGAGAERVRVLPNLPDPALLDLPDPSPRPEPTLLYLGTLSWPPNLDGLERFLRAVFPFVRERAPEARLVVAGGGAPARLARLVARTPGVELVGPVEDAEDVYRTARAFVEPTRGGGGTRLKVLNALARGIPVVASPEGAEGLEVVDGEHLLVAPDARAMAELVSRLLVDDGLWRSLSRKGRDLVRHRYVAEAAFGALEEVL